jgi:hypothetical protein
VVHFVSEAHSEVGQTEPSSENENKIDQLKAPDADDKAKALREIGNQWARSLGYTPVDDLKDSKQPNSSPDPKSDSFDASLARFHFVTATGMGLGTASALYLAPTPELASTVAADISVYAAGGTGLIAATATQRHLMLHSAPDFSQSSPFEDSRSGYGRGIAQVALPSILCAGIGIELFETHATTALGALAVSALLLGGWHWLRHSTFIRNS